MFFYIMSTFKDAQMVGRLTKSFNFVPYMMLILWDDNVDRVIFFWSCNGLYVREISTI